MDPNSDQREKAGLRGLQELFEEQMSRCKAGWLAGVGLAAAEAVTLCRIHKRPPPDWVDAAVVSTIKRNQPEEETRRYCQDMRHYTRYDAVVEARDRCHEFKERGDSRALWKNVFQAVADLLQGREAACGKDQVKASYKLVRDANENGEGARFFTLHHHKPKAPVAIAPAAPRSGHSKV